MYTHIYGHAYTIITQTHTMDNTHTRPIVSIDSKKINTNCM